MTDVYLNQVGLLCALGNDRETVRQRLLAGDRSGLQLSDQWHPEHPSPVGQVHATLPDIPTALARFACRNNQLLMAALDQLRPQWNGLTQSIPPSRIGIVLGTSTSGVDNGEQAMKAWRTQQAAPDSYHYQQQELGNGADFLARLLGVAGPALTLSTACSSSGRALATARSLIRKGVCDVVIAGGADSLCGLTLQGFSSLGAVSPTPCNPFSANRDGINIGEGAALFLLSATPGPVRLSGVGASSDAHHISGPDPHGRGAVAAMAAALHDAGLAPDDIDYLNLHGTATSQNDIMEARAVHELFAGQVPCSATKALTGHCLGAAAALEAALCWLSLTADQPAWPPHCYDGQRDPALPPINLLDGSQPAPATAPRRCQSNAFAFGGNNLSLILETCP
ncbi:beta-ketoacyl-ACP synthase [Alcanivorax sp.]|uniref:beta-ketoacyl-ACP synthase n=1 Tax=Alcanivorax sp. TaxID=1872427 RepID=UPI000C6174A2|nr:beta-ketoacyl-ACP synthase [Alcanivorax sp.]MBQ24924.1 beta-ketoacyl-[acyl-carrier-protein] synthase II [Alcanivorax sp.]